MEVKLPDTHVALVCGGTAPVGASISVQLARAGAGTVVVAGRDEARGTATVAELRQNVSTTSFHFIRADLREQASAEQVFKFVETQCGALDTYVHCVPACAVRGSLGSADLERF